jgi:nitrite reductase (NADH) large subunit
LLNTRYVIIGNSAAALSAIRAIRKKDWSSSITLVSAENCNAYSPVLTTYYIGHKINRNDLFVTDAQFYQDLHVQTKFGSKVTGIETDKQVIHIEDNGIVEYDKLLIATGASPQRNENTETDAFKYVSALRTIEDADKISKL